jgi:hypothetical protein
MLSRYVCLGRCAGCHQGAHSDNSHNSKSFGF